MADKISPEEKLFKVIREGKKEGANPPSEPRGPKRFFSNLSFGKNMFTMGQRPMRAAISGAPRAFSISLSEVQPNTVNTLLAIILLTLVVLIAYVAIKERPRVSTITGRLSAISAEPVKKEMIEEFKPISSYLAEVEKRDVFQPVSLTKQAVAASPQKAAMDKLREIAVDFKLQGISWGQSPKVMIKSEKESRMYFLGEGQAIGSTGVKIKVIHKSKVVIGYENAEMELL